ncbi:pilus assembly protein TadE [Rothia terrae]|uniref:pilus assembly protein TadE n=1 Tax=Rothia terrae TaxID=396015 RepID=UPI0033E3AE4C
MQLCSDNTSSAQQLSGEPARCGEDAESGNAMIEFVVLGLMLMIPTVYFLLAVFQVQSAALAANAASQQAVQLVASTPRDQITSQGLTGAAQLAAADFKVAPENMSVSMSCDGGCSDQSPIRVDVTVQATLPVIPWIAPGGFAELHSSATSWGGKYR